MRPMIDQMYRRPGAAGAYPTPADTPPPGLGGGFGGLNPAIASSLLQGVASQAASSPTAGPSVGSGAGLTSHLHISTNLASFDRLLGQHRASIAFFSSPSSASIGVVFEQLARDKAKTNSIAFIKVDKDVGNGTEILNKYKVGDTPSFLFFRHADRVSYSYPDLTRIALTCSC